MQDNRPEEGVKLHTKGRLVNAASTEVDGDVFSYRGGSTGVVKFLEPLNPLLNYFEYIILNSGEESSIGIGCGDRGYSMSRMPGWNRNSCGYHADDGKLYHESGMGRAFGPTCTVGDRMGCGVNFDSSSENGSVQVFFTKNGQQIGGMERMKRPINGIYPLIGLHSRGERVRYLGHWKRVADGVVEPMEQGDWPGTTWLRCNGVNFVEDGLTVEYAGMGGNIQDVGIAQCRYPLNRTNHYFEFDILKNGTLGALAIGLAKTTYPLHRHPGWNAGSVGYHADDGKLFKERGHGEEFGPSCSEGDRMGCGIRFPIHPLDEGEEEGGGMTESEGSEEDSETGLGQVGFSPGPEFIAGDFDSESEESYSGDSIIEEMIPNHHFARFGGIIRPPQIRVHPQQKRQRNPSGKTCLVYFTKNGEKIGEIECNLPRGGFYPVVAMMSHGEKLRVNFNPITG